MALKQSGRVSDLTVEGMAEYLMARGIRNVLAAEFRRNLVSGEAFLQLTEEDLKELAPLIGERALVRQIQRQSKAGESTLNSRQQVSCPANANSHSNNSIPTPPVHDRTTTPLSHNHVPSPNNSVQLIGTSIVNSKTSIPNPTNSVNPVQFQVSPSTAAAVSSDPHISIPHGIPAGSVIQVKNAFDSNISIPVSSELLSYPTYSPSVPIDPAPNAVSTTAGSESCDSPNTLESEKVYEYTRPLDPDWYLNFAIPEKHTFLEAVQDSIDTGLVTPRARRGLIQVLRTLILQHTKYPTREEYNVVCRKLVEKYPKLHDGGPNGCESWKVCLRNSFKNFRRVHVPRDSRKSRKRKNSASADPTEVPETKLCGATPSPVMDMSVEEYEGILLELREESERGPLRNDEYARQLMDRTFAVRRRWIVDTGPPVMEILEKFPLLDNSEMLRHEFRCVVETDQTCGDMIARWEELKPLIVKMSKVESTSRQVLNPLIAEYETLCAGVTYNTTDQSDYVVLNILLKLLNQREVKGRMFIKRLEVCDVVDVNSADGDEEAGETVPCVVFTSDPGSIEARYFIQYDQVAMCECSSLRDAFLDLVAAYHVFHIAYPKVLQAVLLFFQHEVFEVRDDQPRPMNLFTLVSNLHKLKNDL